MSLTAEQKQFRSSGLGGSDAATILGLSKFSDPLTLYLEKRGEVEFPDTDSRYQRWGKLLEDSVAQAYAEDTGYKVVRSNISHRSKTHPFMIGHIDRKVQKAPNRRILECKTSAMPWEWGEAGSNEVPAYYNAQCQHYMHVLNVDQVDLAALLGGNDFRIYQIPRDQDFIDMLIEAEEEFWDRVEAGVPPEATWEAASTTRLLKHLYPGTNGSVVKLPTVAQKYHDVLADAKAQRLMFEKVEEGCKNRLKMLMGEASAAILPDGTVWTRKLESRSEKLVAGYEFMSFRHTTRVPKAVKEAIENGTAKLIEG
jgi:putative phage-type endonuclease